MFKIPIILSAIICAQILADTHEKPRHRLCSDASGSLHIVQSISKTKLRTTKISMAGCEILIRPSDIKVQLNILSNLNSLNSLNKSENNFLAKVHLSRVSATPLCTLHGPSYGPSSYHSYPTKIMQYESLILCSEEISEGDNSPIVDCTIIIDRCRKRCDDDSWCVAYCSAARDC